VAALAEALRLGHPQGYVRVFADEGPPMGALLGRLLAAQRSDRAAADLPLEYSVAWRGRCDRTPPVPARPPPRRHDAARWPSRAWWSR
jgi:hypothetical protein